MRKARHSLRLSFILPQLLAERESLRTANSAHELEQNDLALKEIAAQLKVREEVKVEIR